MSFTNLFGGQSIKSAQVQYEPITFAADVTLVWPLESTEGQQYVAAWIDAFPAVAALSIFMPNATQSALGTVSTIQNIGTDSFTLKDTSGNQIGVIAAGEAWIVNLTDNTDLNGQWELVQLGATTSNAQASALAGPGLQAILTKLQTIISTRYTAADGNIVAADRSFGIVWQGSAPGTLQLDTIANLTVGWWALVTNQGTDPLTIMTSGDTINGVAQIVLPATGGPEYYSALIVASATGFNVFQAAPSPIPIAGGGTGATNAGDALINLGGTSVGISIFTAPTVAAVLALLGITPTALTEQTIATNTNVGATAGIAFVATAALTLFLAQTTTLTDTFFFAIYAEGGQVTITPNGADSINGGSAGANFIVPQGASLLMVTDAAGNWWPLFVSTPAGTSTGFVVTAGATYTVADGIENVIVFKTVGSATTITLPVTPTPWRRITVKDLKGDADTNQITVVGTIDGGVVNFVMNFPFQAQTFQWVAAAAQWALT